MILSRYNMRQVNPVGSRLREKVQDSGKGVKINWCSEIESESKEGMAVIELDEALTVNETGYE